MLTITKLKLLNQNPMKITIEIPDDCYGDYMDEDDNLITVSPPVGDGAKREKLLDMLFDEWECFRFEIACVVVDALLGTTPGYTHPEINKSEETILIQPRGKDSHGLPSPSQSRYE